ncbi:probable glutamate receptor isoform X3 [Palaemon carinicauda]|uniref:probable glutamate receptor isoform X3 n=1 Tax=Palaemon carinicauda TaxID=392227 RepID=UPI0035B57BE2
MFPITRNSLCATLALMMATWGSAPCNLTDDCDSPDVDPHSLAKITGPPNHCHRNKEQPVRNISAEDVMLLIRTVVKNSNRSLTFSFGQEYEEVVNKSAIHVAEEFIVLMSLKNDGETKTFRRMLSLSQRNNFLLLLDTPANIVSLFQMMRKAMLKTHLTRWLLLMEGSDASNSVVRLQEFVNEGTQVVPFVKTLGGHMVYFLPSVNPDGVTQYKAFLSQDDVWGDALPNGNATGVIGMVARREAVIGVSALAISESRLGVVDFTCPYITGMYLLMSRSPKEKNRALAVLSPFQLKVWICVTLTVLLMGPVLWLISYVVKNYVTIDGKAINYQWFHLNIFRNVVNQGNFIQEESLPIRVVLAFWFLFCLINAALYSGMLTAVLAIPAYETPIDSLEDLPRATKEGFTVGTLEGSSYETLFKTATEGIFKQTWDLFNHEDRSRSFVGSSIVGGKRVLEEKFVFIISDRRGHILAKMFGEDRIHLSKERFLPLHVGIACQIGSPVTGALTRVLLRMKEGGILSKMGDDLVRNIPVYPSAKTLEEKRSAPITLTHLQAAFYIFCIGTLTSTATFLEETIIFSHFITK